MSGAVGTGEADRGGFWQGLMTAAAAAVIPTAVQQTQQVKLVAVVLTALALLLQMPWTLNLGLDCLLLLLLLPAQEATCSERGSELPLPAALPDSPVSSCPLSRSV